MAIHDDARVTVLMADYVAADAGGKLTAVGAAFTLIGLQPDGQTPPLHVAVLVDVASPFVGQDFALGISLVDNDDGQPVLVLGPSGEVEPLRVAQVVRALTPSVPGALLPAGLPGRVQVVLGFPGGLALQAGRSYRWSVELDGTTHPAWSAWFHVPMAAPGPVFGGPVGSATIPRI